MTAGAAVSGLVTKHASSVQLTVDARSTATRIGSTFGISGSNIDTTDGSTTATQFLGTITSGVYSPGTIASSRYRDKYLVSVNLIHKVMLFQQVSSTVGQIPNFGSLTSYTAWNCW